MHRVAYAIVHLSVMSVYFIEMAKHILKLFHLLVAHHQVHIANFQFSTNISLK